MTKSELLSRISSLEEANRKLDAYACGLEKANRKLQSQINAADAFFPQAAVETIEAVNRAAELEAANAELTKQRDEVLEEAAKIADGHHENHCENQDGDYRNCGMAIATGIRHLKGKRA